MRAIGIIPARGGSKGISRKNLREVAGKPLIAYSILAGQQSESLDSVIVTTDDAEIQRVSASLNCETVMRPSELADDNTPMVPVILHVLSELEARGRVFDVVVLLQPTAPMRTERDIDAAVRILEDSGANSVISVYRVEDAHPARMYRLAGQTLVPYAEEPTDGLRQSLPPVYHRNGAIYVCRVDYFLDRRRLVSPDCRAYIMPKSRSLNVDAPFDLICVDAIMSRDSEGHPESAVRIEGYTHNDPEEASSRGNI